jgi:hypothetical protein
LASSVIYSGDTVGLIRHHRMASVEYHQTSSFGSRRSVPPDRRFDHPMRQTLESDVPW